MSKLVYLTDEEISLICSGLQMKVSKLREFANTEYTDFNNSLVEHRTRYTHLIHKVENEIDHVLPKQIWELAKLDDFYERTWNDIVAFNTWMGYEWDLSENEISIYTFGKCVEDSAEWTTEAVMELKLEGYGYTDVVKMGDLYIIELCYGNGSNGRTDTTEKEFRAFRKIDVLWKALKWVFEEEIIYC